MKDTSECERMFRTIKYLNCILKIKKIIQLNWQIYKENLIAKKNISLQMQLIKLSLKF